MIIMKAAAGKWLQNSFLLGSNCLANHGGQLTIDSQAGCQQMGTLVKTSVWPSI